MIFIYLNSFVYSSAYFLKYNFRSMGIAWFSKTLKKGNAEIRKLVSH